MNRMIRGIHSTLGKVIVLFAFALSLLVTSAVAFADQESGGEHQKRHRKDDKDVGLRGHGFVSENGAFTTIDAPRAEAFTIAFGIDEGGRTVGGYVDERGRLHGFLKDKEAFTVIDFPGAKATFAARINDRGDIVGAYSEESNTPALSLPHGFLLQDGAFTKIEVPGARRTQPFGINNLGQIVGEYVDAAGRSHGFLLDNGVFTTIDAPAASGVEGPGGTSTIAFDINDDGQIVGISFTDAIVTGFGSAFLRDANGVFTTIAVPDSFITVPFGINNRGQVVGQYEDAVRNGHGFVVDQGAVTTIDAPDATGGTFVFEVNEQGQLAGAYDLVAHGYLQDRRGDFTTIDHPDAVRLTGELISINNHGQIAGVYGDAQGVFRGFLLDKHRFTNIDVPDALQTRPFKINDQGQIVGGFDDAGGVTHGFLLDDGVFTTIDFPGALLTQALDINNHGQIVGQYVDAAGIFHSFLRGANGDFTTVDIPGATETAAFAINDRGQIVGLYRVASGPFQAFLLDQGVVTPINFPGAVATQPSGINNRGQIVGSYVDGGRRHGFLLSDGEFKTLTDPPGAFLESLALDLDDHGRIVGLYF
jgi:probable HAF family extracellular repeat protein